MKWDDSLDALLLYQERYGTVPPALLARPEDPSPQASFYLSAFDLLSSFRGSNGFSLNPIPYADIAHYAAQVGYTSPEEFFEFASAIGTLDREYRNLSADKNTKKKK